MLKVLGGSSNPMLVEDICKMLSFSKQIEVCPVDVTLKKFLDGETRVEINENLRGDQIFVIQSITNNDNLIELSLILDALKRCNVAETTVIIPYYGYSRQDKKDRPRVPISAKLVADIIQLGDISRVVTIDLHSNQIQGFFNCPVDNLYAMYTLINYVPVDNNLVVVSPDAGGMQRAKSWANKLNCEMAFCYKYRKTPNDIGEMKLIGDVEGKDCILVDDMIDTAGTLCKCSTILAQNKANNIYAFATHPVLSGKAIENIDNSMIDSVYVTNTIPLKENVLKNNKFNVILIDELISEVIYNIYNGYSVSNLFN